MNKKKMIIITSIVAIVFFECICILFLLAGQEKTHEYYCDEFLLTADEKQIDLSEVMPDMLSVSEILPITDDHLYIMGRVDESTNAMIIYDFKKQEIVFAQKGTTMCWVQDDYNSMRYLKDNPVYDLEENVIYEAEAAHTIQMIEYVDTDFCVTVADLEKQTIEQVWVE